MRRTRSEPMLSAYHPMAATERTSRIGSFAPESDSCIAAKAVHGPRSPRRRGRTAQPLAARTQRGAAGASYLFSLISASLTHFGPWRDLGFVIASHSRRLVGTGSPP